MSFVTTAAMAYSQIQQGSLAREAASGQAQELEFRAAMERQTALQRAGVIRRAGGYALGTARASIAASGVKVGQGSAQDIEAQLNRDVEHDAFAAILDGERRALGLNTDASGALAHGRAAQAAGYMNATMTALAGTYGAMRSSGWRSNGPGFSGTQAPAPVETRTINVG